MENNIIMYQAADGTAAIDVKFENETIWLTQRQIADVFGCGVDNVGLHLRNIYKEAELLLEATAEDFSVVRFEGGRSVRRSVKHYNLDAILSVGYRVNSKNATQFRVWDNFNNYLPALSSWVEHRDDRTHISPLEIRIDPIYLDDTVLRVG